MVTSGKLMSYRMVRKFVVDYLQLDDFSTVLYAAFQAPDDDIFYQSRDSDDWKLLDQHTKMYEIENQEKYQWQLRFLMNSIVATGSAAFKMMEEESLVKKGWSGITHGAYYRVMKEEGSAQFRYWIAENRHDYKKMLTFFNIQNESKMVKQSSKIVLDSIKVNQIIYVPMLSKIFDMEEANKYDNLTDQKLQEIRNNPEVLDFTGKEVRFHIKKLNYVENNQVRIRFLSDQAAPVNFSDGTIRESKKKGSTKYEKVILHFHGGGFIVQDSGAHQNYTRKWAIDLGIPVFSVDYRLAPKNPYPDPVNDCYQAYVWIVTQAKQQLGLDID